MNSVQKVPDKLEVEIHGYTVNGLLPPMSPDMIDDFITWAHPRFCIHSFSRSGIKLKISKLREFLKECPPEKRQYKLNL